MVCISLHRYDLGVKGKGQRYLNFASNRIMQAAPFHLCRDNCPLPLFEITTNRTLVKSIRNEKLIFLFLNQNICCGYSKESPQ